MSIPTMGEKDHSYFLIDLSEIENKGFLSERIQWVFFQETTLYVLETVLETSRCEVFSTLLVLECVFPQHDTSANPQG